MIKKGSVLFILFIFLVLISGCETIKGAFTRASNGAKKDWQAAKSVDGWMRKNLW